MLMPRAGARSTIYVGENTVRLICRNAEKEAVARGLCKAVSVSLRVGARQKMKLQSCSDCRRPTLRIDAQRFTFSRAISGPDKIAPTS